MTVTLKDIAARCDLAVSTVSNILNDQKTCFASAQAKALVKRTAAAMGYRGHYLSASLRTGRTSSLGLCLDYISNETRHAFVEAFVEACAARDYEVALTCHRLDPARAIEALRIFGERYKDGVVLFTDFLRDIGGQRPLLDQAVRDCRAKVLGIGSEMRGRLPCLDVERDWAFADCARRLAPHRRVLLVYKTPGDLRHSVGLFAQRRFVHMQGVHTIADFRRLWPAARRAHPDITAVFFRTDEVAIPALRLLADSDTRVPEQLAVFSFDNFRFSDCTTPPLSTYDIRMGELGRMAAQRMLGWLQGGRQPAGGGTYHTIRPTFVPRASHLRPRTGRDS